MLPSRISTGMSKVDPQINARIIGTVQVARNSPVCCFEEVGVFGREGHP
jgi:hypothetical protein